MKSNSTNKMNFFAKRPKTPAELVKAVKELLAPGGRLDGTSGNIDGRKKVSPAFPSLILAAGGVFEGGERKERAACDGEEGGRRRQLSRVQALFEGTMSSSERSLKDIIWPESTEVSLDLQGKKRGRWLKGRKVEGRNELVPPPPSFDRRPVNQDP